MPTNHTKAEFDAALRGVSDGQVPGIDNIPAESLKNAGEKMKEQPLKIITDCHENNII